MMLDKAGNGRGFLAIVAANGALNSVLNTMLWILMNVKN